MKRAIVLFLLILATPVMAEELQHLRDSQSPDGSYDCFLLNQEGKLRFRIVDRKANKTLIEFPSAYESLMESNSRAAESAHKAHVAWSPDSRYVIFKEPDNSDAQYGVTLLSVSPEAAKLVPLTMERIEAASPKKHTDWMVEFNSWLGNRTFYLTLHGMTYRTDGANEHDRMPLLVRIKPDGGFAIVNADE